MSEPISSIKERHQGEWVAVRVTREEQGIPVEGEVVSLATSRWGINMAVNVHADDLYVFFARSPVNPDCYLVTRFLFGFSV